MNKDPLSRLPTPFRRVARLTKLLGVSQMVYFVVQRLLNRAVVRLAIPGIRTRVYCRTRGSDILVLWQIIESAELNVNLSAPPALIIDGGANVGYSSLYLANRYPQARIVAIEPDPSNCALFRQNCAQYPSITLVQGALWHRKTVVATVDDTVASWAIQVHEVDVPSDKTIPTYTIPEILALCPGMSEIDLLKLDIEGAEEQLFSSDYEEWLGHVNFLMVELHGPRCKDVVCAVMEAHGFAVTQSGEYTVFAR